MTRPEDGRDGGIYSSDSTGQTPSLASIYQVGSDDLNLAHIYRVSQKNALSESSSCKLTRQRDPPRLLGACKPGLWAWMDCRTAMMILKVRFFWDTL